MYQVTTELICVFGVVIFRGCSNPDDGSFVVCVKMTSHLHGTHFWTWEFWGLLLNIGYV